MKSLAGRISLLSVLVLMPCLLMSCGPSLTRAQALQRINAELTWVPIAGGEFEMGCDEGEPDCPLVQRPRHKVRLADFEMSKTEVSLGAYRACVAAGACTKATGDAPACLWDKPGMDALPVNCVSREQAKDFAEFVGARLPSEAEWEYAARSRGKDQPYPWGQQAPTCRHAAVHDRSETVPCPEPELLPRGSRPSGDSIQGVSDLVGNVAEWVADCYDGDYAHAKKDGSPVLHPHRSKDVKWCTEPGDFIFSTRRVECPPDPDEKPPACKMGVVRGGFYLSSDSKQLRVTRRGSRWLDDRDPFVGIRLARDAAPPLSAEAAEAKAAASGDPAGKSFPWGAEAPSCERAVLFELSCFLCICNEAGCDKGRPWSICSHRTGDNAFGVCDLVGNVGEWLADCHNKDGSPCEDRWGAVAGGGWISVTKDMTELEVKQRVRNGRWRDVGIRLVR